MRWWGRGGGSVRLWSGWWWGGWWVGDRVLVGGKVGCGFNGGAGVGGVLMRGGWVVYEVIVGDGVLGGGLLLELFGVGVGWWWWFGLNLGCMVCW